MDESEKRSLEVMMLRPSDFTPFRDMRQYGERLLHVGVDRRDVIAAVAKAVECKQTFGAYHIVRDDPFTEDDMLTYSDSPIEIMEKVYPGSTEIIENYKFTLPAQIHKTIIVTGSEKSKMNGIRQYTFIMLKLPQSQTGKRWVLLLRHETNEKRFHKMFKIIDFIILTR